MLTSIVQHLTHEQRVSLAKRGLTRQRLHDFLHGNRLPTEVQVADIAEVAGCSWAELQAEVTVMRAPKDQRSRVARVVGKLVDGAKAITLTFVAAASALGVADKTYAAPTLDNV